jgi:hypothetical protein
MKPLASRSTPVIDKGGCKLYASHGKHNGRKNGCA